MIEAIAASPAVYAIGWSLVQFAWQGTLVAAIAALVLFALSGADARIRYWTACATMLIMVALPIRTAVGAYMTMAPESGRNRIAGTAPISVVPSHAETPAVPMPVTGTRAIGDTAAGGSWAMALNLRSFIPAIVMAWILGVLALSIRIAGGWVLVRRMRRQSARASAELTNAVNRIARRARLARPVQVFESAIVEVPAVVGWLRPVVLLPASAVTGLSPEQVEAVIAHELAHVRRQDYLVNIFQTLAETLLFYHPGVWWLSNRIRAEREHCADDFAVTVCGDAVLYAQALSNLETARAAARLAVGASGSSLSGRIKRILGQPAHRNRPASVGLALAATVAVVLLGFGGSQAALVAAPPPIELPAPPPLATVEPASTPQARPVEEPRPAPEQSNAAEPANGLQETPAESEEPPTAGTGLGGGVGTGQGAGIGEGLGAGLGQGIGAGLGTGLGQGIGAGLGAGLGEGLSAGLGAGLGEGLSAGLGAGLGQGIGAGLGAGLGEGVGAGFGAGLGQGAGRNVQIFRNVLESVFQVDPGRSESSWMGVRIEDGPDRGVVVTGVEPDGPAIEAGIQEGDLITAFDGTAVVGAVQLTRLVSETPVGRTVEITFSRNAEEQNATLTISARPIQFEVVSRPSITVSQTPDNWSPDDRYLRYSNMIAAIAGNVSFLGVQVDEMTSELRQFFGADPEAGILIVSMDDDSIGAGAGLQVGDVIVAVDGNRVGSASDLRNLSGGVLATGNALTVTVMRDGSEREIEVEPPLDL